MKCLRLKYKFILFAFFLIVGIAVSVQDIMAKTSKKQLNQVCDSSTVAIPEIATDYVLIYRPQPDIYNRKSGKIYQKWQPNDHTFVKGPNGRWHCIGITHPEEDGRRISGSGLGTFHSLAPFGTLENAFFPETWIDQPKLQLGNAPYIVKIEGVYHYINSANDHRISTDLYDWKNMGKLKLKKEKGKDTRDPNILYWNGTYYMVRCNDNSVNLVTSTDFENWSDPVDIYNAPVDSWRCESPTLLRYNDKFYLFWCMWDSSPYREKLLALYKGHTPWSYDYRTFVYVSDTPTDFNNREPITQLKAHAPEIIQDEKGSYFISSADYPHRGINLARLEWKLIKH